MERPGVVDAVTVELTTFGLSVDDISLRQATEYMKHRDTEEEDDGS